MKEKQKKQKKIAPPIRVHKFGQFEVALGLQWYEIATKGRQKKIDEAKSRADSGCSFGLALPSIDGNAQGAVGWAPKKTNAIIGAAWLASANADFLKTLEEDAEVSSTWVVVERLDESQFWLCAISNGLPLPGGDFLGSYEDVGNKLAEYMQVFEVLDIYTLDDSIQELVSIMTPAINKGFLDLVGSAPLPGKLVKLGGLPPAVIWGALGLMLVGAGGVGVDTFLEEQKKKVAAEKVARERATRAQQVAVQRQEATANALQKTKQAKEAIIEQLLGSLKLGPVEMAESWEGVFKQVPTNHSGWKMDGIVCIYGQPCVVNLTRGVATNRMLLELNLPNLQITNENATYYLDGTVRARDLALTDVPSTQEFDKHTISEFQVLKMLGIDIAFDRPSMINYDRTIVNIPQDPNAPPVESRIPVATGFSSGIFTLKGQGILLIKEVAKYLNRPEITFQSVEIGFGEASEMPVWLIRGQYTVKEDDNAVLDLLTNN